MFWITANLTDRHIYEHKSDANLFNLGMLFYRSCVCVWVCKMHIEHIFVWHSSFFACLVLCDGGDDSSSGVHTSTFGCLALYRLIFIESQIHGEPLCLCVSVCVEWFLLQKKACLTYHPLPFALFRAYFTHVRTHCIWSIWCIQRRVLFRQIIWISVQHHTASAHLPRTVAVEVSEPIPFQEKGFVPCEREKKTHWNCYSCFHVICFLCVRVRCSRFPVSAPVVVELSPKFCMCVWILFSLLLLYISHFQFEKFAGFLLNVAFPLILSLTLCFLPYLSFSSLLLLLQALSRCCCC